MFCMVRSCEAKTLTSRHTPYEWCVFDEGKVICVETLDDLPLECTHCVVVHGESMLSDLVEKELVVLSAPQGFNVEDVAEAFMFRELYEVEC